VSSLRRVGAILEHELRIVGRDPTPLLVLIVFPVITIAFLKPALRPALVQGGYPDASGAEQVVPGQAVMSAFFLVSLVTLAFFAEHGWATWDRLRASPATPLEIIVGKSLPRVAIGIIEFVVVMGAGVVIFGLAIRGSAWAMAPLVIAFSVCLVLLGVAATAVSRTAQQANAFAFTGMVLFGAIGGAFVPFRVLPDWAQTVAPVTPTYWAMRGMRSIVLDGQGIGGVVAPTAMLLAMSVLFAAIALWRFRFDEVKTGFV
jgi:ABC-2 type transport system permease protein